jgi:hypothetical protein
MNYLEDFTSSRCSKNGSAFDRISQSIEYHFVRKMLSKKKNVGRRRIAEQSSFAGAGLSDDVDMLPLVAGGYAKRQRFSVAFAVSDHNVWFVRFQNQPPLPKVPVVSDSLHRQECLGTGR